MVGDKYTWLAPLAGSLLLCPYSGPAVLHEVREVVYSLAENKTNISTRFNSNHAVGAQLCHPPRQQAIGEEFDRIEAVTSRHYCIYASIRATERMTELGHEVTSVEETKSRESRCVLVESVSQTEELESGILSADFNRPEAVFFPIVSLTLTDSKESSTHASFLSADKFSPLSLGSRLF